jgi:triphosphoribosyl-dephospho-CoA synthase
MIESAKTNTSLGTILLFAPLSVAFRKLTKLEPSEVHDNTGFDSIQASLHFVLEALTSQDSVMIYRAIQLAKPGGLGESQSMDVQGEAPVCILDAMRHAATWDDIALQYVTCFELVFAIADRIRIKQSLYQNSLEAIRHVQLELLSERVDSLIARKRGAAFAKQVQEWAKCVVGSGEYQSESFEAAWHELDEKLRNSSNGANPGTTADLIAGAIFVLNLSRVWSFPQ